MKSRDDMIGQLADEIVSGTLRHRRINLASVLDAVLDEPFFDQDEVATFIGGTTECCMTLRLRAEKRAQGIVVSWLTSDPGGRALVDERMEKEREEALEDSL